LQPSLAFCFSLQPMTAYRPVTVRRHWLQAKTKCASLAGLVLSFIACFILLVIAPLTTISDHQLHLMYILMLVVQLNCCMQLTTATDNASIYHKEKLQVSRVLFVHSSREFCRTPVLVNFWNHETQNLIFNCIGSPTNLGIFSALS